MICYQCKKKSVCKHYDNLLSIMTVATVSIDSCEHYLKALEGEAYHTSYEEEVGTIEVKRPYLTPTTLDKMAENLKNKEPRFFFPDLKQKESTSEPNLMQSINQFAKTDIYIQEPEYREGICSHCNQETQVYTCECGTVSCEECGMPPYCKTCWEEK